MLVLSRRRNEGLHIGQNIRVVIVSIDRDQMKVRLGIEAPPEVPVHRDEVWLDIQRQEQGHG